MIRRVGQGTVVTDFVMTSNCICVYWWFRL